MLEFLNVGKLNSQIKGLQGQLADWNSKFTQLEQAYETLKNDTQEAMDAKVTFDSTIQTLKDEYEGKLTVMTNDRAAEVTKLTEDYEGKLTELKNKYEAEVKTVTDTTLNVDESANVKAAEIVSQIGIEQGTVKVSDTVVTDPTQLVKTYQELLKTNPEAAKEYYKEHRSEIIQFVGFKLK